MHSRLSNPCGQLSRRQLVCGLAAAAGSLAVPQAWAKPASAPHWPLLSVEGNGGKAYLFGQTPPRAKPWHDTRIEQLLLGCSALWTETNSLRRGNMGELMQRYGMDAKTPLMERLSAADQQRLTKAARLAGMKLADLAPLRAWSAGMELDGAYHHRINHPESGSAEKVLMAIAKKAQVPLESEFPAQDDVIAYMGAYSAEQEMGFLGYTMDQILAGPVETERTYADWARGDSGRADREVLRLKAQYPAMYESLVLGRNRNWVPRFEAMLHAEKPAMVVLGLYHLAGPDSVQVQLQAKGWTVKAV